MSLAAAQTDIVTACEAALAAWSGEALLVEWPNRKVVHVETMQDPYICIEIHYVDGGQLSIGQTKVLADYGQIHITACLPEGAGSLLAMQMLDHFRTFFELKAFSVVRTHASRAAPSKPHNGWEMYPVVVPFWIHRLVVSS